LAKSDRALSVIELVLVATFAIPKLIIWSSKKWAVSIKICYTLAAMNHKRFNLSRMNDIGNAWQLRVLLAVSIIWLGPTIACGSFAPRPLPTPTTAIITPVDPQISTGGVGGLVAAEPITPTANLLATETSTPAPTPTFTATPVPGTALAKGQPARVTTEDGLNLRDKPATSGQLITRLGGGQRVTVIDGPVSADDFTWWKIDDGQGNIGWAVQGDKDGDWLSPKLGDPQPSNRAPKVGERVQVTTETDQLLTIRATPGRDAPILAQVGNGKQYTVVAGPQSADGFTWYQIRSDDGSLVGWAADGDSTKRWLSPLE
jgi:uncharacterized protein YgiM (DUF1202 family)